MAIIYLPINLRQLLDGVPFTPLVCPVADHPLVKNGGYARQADDTEGEHSLRIQRFRCQTCGVNYSALPYDCRPFTAATWSITLDLGWLWRAEQGWTWKQCLAWLESRGIARHHRTLERWAARWRAGLPQVVQGAVQWIGAVWGTRTLTVWPTEQQTVVEHWRDLWRQVVALPDPNREHRSAGWMGDSVLWNWIPITFFAGLSNPAGSARVWVGGESHSINQDAVP